MLNCILIVCISSFVHFTTSQDICNITWTSQKNSNFRDAFRAFVVSRIDECLSKCEVLSSCVAVDIDMRNENDNFYTCWFHSNPNDIKTAYSYQGVDTYVKNVNCSRFPYSNGNTGYTGATGPTGAAGPPGSSGTQGLQGPRGSMGATGLPGVTGQSGFTGFTGDAGYTGSPGLQGSPARNVGTGGARGGSDRTIHVFAICQPSWSINYNTISSSGSFDPPVATTGLSQCQDICLSIPSCVAVEFNRAGSICRIQNGSVSTTRFNSGTDQYVLTSRCTSNAIPFNSGATGSRGQDGIRGSNGAVGISGVMGETGLTGHPGQVGIKGVSGAPGATGMEGSVGSTGLKGPLGVLGASLITSSDGSLVYVAESCRNSWVSVRGYKSPNAASTRVSSNSTECQGSCLNYSNCVAVDFHPNDGCALHTNLRDLISKVVSPGSTQFVLVSKCSSSSSSPQLIRKKRSSGDGDDISDNQKCIPMDDDIWSRPETYTLFVTPALTLLVNLLCCFVYFFAKKTLRRKV